MVIWIIGKSGSGKTYLSKHLIKSLKKKKLKKIIWIDGDKFRKRYSKDLGYSLVDRKKNSKRIQNFCKKYDEKGYLVICSILSIFTNHQKINRKKFSNYFQIYIKTDTKILKFRNNKMVYSKKKNVVGKDIPFPKPYKSNAIIKNDFKKTFLNNIKKIENKIYAKIL